MNVMKKSWATVLLLFIGLTISLIGFKYRIRQYDQIPFVNQSFDEIGYLWLGKSLLSTGVPANWSALGFYSQYQKSEEESVNGYNIVVNGKSPSIKNWSTFMNPAVWSIEGSFDNNYKSQFLIVQPYLDNPPLAGIIFALVDSGESMTVSSIKQIRLIPIIALSATITTIFLLGFLLANFNVGLISALIYCLGPGFVISSRMAVPENLLAALLPLCLLLFYYYQKTKRTYLLSLLCIFCFLAVWLKVSGLIIPLVLIMICFNKKMYRVGWIIVASAILGFLSYVGYCMAYSPRLFLQMISTQGSRMFAGPASILVKILNPEVPSSFYDGWIILGYMSVLGLVYISKKNKNLNYISYSVVGFLIFFMMFGGLNFPWYQFIIYPILALSLGVVINNFLVKPRFEFNLLFFLTVVSTLLHFAQYTNNWIIYLNTYRLLLIVFVLGSSFGWFFRRSRKFLLRASLVMMIIYSFYLGITIINNLNYLWPLLMQNKISLY